jgi:hypothetical protein
LTSSPSVAYAPKPRARFFGSRIEECRSDPKAGGAGEAAGECSPSKDPNLAYWRTARRMVVRLTEVLMSRPRAADDFKTIRARLDELQREKLPAQPAPTTDTPVAFHRGPCACGRSLFPDECDGSCKF